MISIIAVNWWAKEFAQILIASILNNVSNGDFEIIIVDNSGELNVKNKGINILHPGRNLGHGRGMDLAIRDHAKGEYIMVLDIDAHILAKDFDKKIIEEYNKNDKIKLMGAQGGSFKPIRPLLMFFEKKFFIENEMSFQGVSCNQFNFDVGVHFYFRTLQLRYLVKFFNIQKTEFKDVWGDDYLLNGERLAFHHWYGTRWFGVNGEKIYDHIDDRDYSDYLKSKENLFKQINK